MRYPNLKTQEEGGDDGVIDEPIVTPFHPDMIFTTGGSLRSPPIS